MRIRQIFEKHPHWQEVLAIKDTLLKGGYKAYLAGGSVRDALLGLSPHDFDIATDAKPAELEKLFKSSIPVGRDFGVMMLPLEDKSRIEIATFRADGDYKDGRHPESVEFLSPREDALRRDFTVNALFYDLSEDKLIDFVEGEKDLEKRLLKAVGNPEKRFREDKLRLMRAIRFQAQLGFQIDEKTLSAIELLAPEIKVVSKERLTDEFKKILKSRSPALGISALHSTGLLKYLWSDLKLAETSGEFWEKTLSALYSLSKAATFEVVIALFLVEETFLRRLDSKDLKPQWEKLPFIFSRSEKRDIEFLVQGVEALKTTGESRLLLLNEEAGPLLTELCFALTTTGQFPAEKVGENIDAFLKVSDANGRLPEPFLSGDDLLKLGVKPSAEMGELLREVYLKQIGGVVRDIEQAKEFIRMRTKH